ncbi:MAG: hypothetical protein MUE81_22430 [Thermoflexibacter sp.]|jgi:Tol biopolymer transport system component|nr:hypothetical protein [Thermoflexibacter sp.]
MNSLLKGCALALLVCFIYGLPTLAQVRIEDAKSFSIEQTWGAVISPDSLNLLFIGKKTKDSYPTIFHTQRKAGKWVKPTIAPFVDTDTEAQYITPAFSSGGRAVLFSSNCPVMPNERKSDFDIWLSSKTRDNQWASPHHLGGLLNSEADDFHPSIANSGVIYFASAREGSYGKVDIYKSKIKKGFYQKPENLGNIINFNVINTSPFISPNEDFLIFFSHADKDSLQADLYISFYKNNQWEKPICLGKSLKVEKSSFCPFISSDGKYFYFERGEMEGENKQEHYARLDIKNLKITMLKKRVKIKFSEKTSS